MKMSESEGLIKLTEYLKQTRRQAEAAIDHLNEQIAILNNDNELKSQKLQDAYDQIRNMKLQMEKMKEDTSMKAVFKERDDWKSLVDSIQKDRARLQEENQALSVDLDFARDQISKLVDQVQELVRERDELVARGSTNDQLAINVPSDPPQSISPSASSHDSIILSPIIDRRTGRPIVFQDSNHESLSRRLKDELKRVHDEMEEERRKAAAELNNHIAEIVRLKGQLVSDSAASSNASVSRHVRHSQHAVDDNAGWFSWFFSSAESNPHPPVKHAPAGSAKKLPIPRILNV